MPNDDRSLKHAGLLLFGVVLVFNLVMLWPEVPAAAPPSGSDAFFIALSSQLADAIREGGQILDPWIPTWTMGFPVFHHYPPLPGLVTAAAFVLLPIDSSAIFNGLKYILLCSFPIVVYYSVRVFGLPCFEACLVSSSASWISTRGLYGLDYNSYVWIGLGLYTQLWGMVLLPLVLCRSYRALREGRQYWMASLLLAILILSHAIFAYASLITLAFFSIWGVKGVRFDRRLFRMGRIVLPALALSAFLWVPHLLDLHFLNRSVWEGSSKYNSYGAPLVLYQLFHGNLFDAARPPVFTLFLGVGLLTCFWTRLKGIRIFGGTFLLWLLLFFGRATWGSLMDLLPLSQELRLHRFLGLVHLFGVLMIGLGLAVVVRWIYKPGDWKRLSASIVLLMVFFGTAGRERFVYFRKNNRAKQEAASEYRSREAALKQTFEEIRRRNERLPGRTYAGLGTNWGRDFTVGHVPMDAHLAGAKLPALGPLYHSMALVSDIQVIFNERLLHHYDLFNVRYVLAPPEHSFPDFVTLEDAGVGWNLWRAPATGYFALVRSNLALWGDKRHLYRINRQWLESSYPAAENHPTLFLGQKDSPANLDYRMVFHLDESLALPALSPDDKSPPKGFTLDERVRNERARVTVFAHSPAVVLFKMSYHPNWQVAVDGRGRELLLLTPGFMGVRVEAGRHDVEFHYNPGPLKRVLLVLGLLAMTGVVFLEHRSRPEDPSHTTP